MPIYEYQCPQCQHRFEEWTKVADAQGAEPCPMCGAPASRIMSQTSFVLKGGGWYVSDYGYRKGVTEDGAPADSQSSDSAPAAEPPSGRPAPDKAPAAQAPAPPGGAGAGAQAPAAPPPPPTSGTAPASAGGNHD